MMADNVVECRASSATRMAPWRRERCTVVSAIMVIVVGLLHFHLRRNVSNHKLLNVKVITLLSIALTLGASAFALCVLVFARWVHGRVRSDREGDWGCSTSLRGRNRRTCFIVVFLCIVAVITKFGSTTSSGACSGSLRIFHDLGGNNSVRLCAKAWHIPSFFFVWESSMRFLGDTFLFRDEEVIAHLDWKTAVLETDQCKAQLKSVPGRNATDGGGECNNDATAIALGMGPSPKDRPWKTKLVRNTSLLAPFRVSNELLQPDALYQANLVTKQLKDCRLDSTHRVVLKSSSSSASSPHREPLVLEANSKHGQGVAIILSASNTVDSNVYHIMHMDSGSHCLFLALQNAAASSDNMQQRISIVLPMPWESPVGNSIVASLAGVFGAEVLTLDRNYTYLQQQRTYKSLVHVHGPYIEAIPALVRSGSLGFCWPMWDSFKFEANRLPSSFGIAYANAVRRGNRMQLQHQQKEPLPFAETRQEHVVVVQRRNTRRLVGSRTGTFAEIIDAMCSLGLPISIVEFETMTVEEQIQAVSSSTVMLAAHGAGMSHAAWMRPGAAVVEVLMRQGFAGSDYHKADFANLARFYGKKYVYYDAVSLMPSNARGIGANNIVVDADELAQVILCLFEKFQNGFLT